MSTTATLPALTSTVPNPPPPPVRGDDVDPLFLELIKFGGPSGLVVVLFYALLKEWIVVGPAHRRELADVVTQRDKAQEQAERLLDINAKQSDALREYARKEDLGSYSIEAIKRQVVDGGGGA